jgi:DNA-directed RNA polymerase, mitochondrial
MGDASETPLPVELEKAVERFDKRETRAIKAEGPAAQRSALAIAEKCLPDFAAGLTQGLAIKKVPSVHREFLATIRGLPVDVLALAILQSSLHSIAQRENFIEAAIRIGGQIGAECYARALTEHAPKRARLIASYARTKSNVASRRKAARTAAARANFKTKDWERTNCLLAGSWAIDKLCKILPGTFTVEGKAEHQFLTITKAAEAYADYIVTEVILKNPVWLPRPELPLPWTGWNDGGISDKRLTHHLNVMRSGHKQTRTAVSNAIRDGSMRPTLGALNSLQSVAWKINTRVLNVLHACVANKIEVPGLPSTTQIGAPEAARTWEDMDDDERKIWKRQTDEIRQANTRSKGSRVLLAEDLQTADMLDKHERFYTAMNMDWRGRVYSLASFNFQRDDRVRALFRFADGKPISEDGIYWLKVHVANHCDFDQISKRPFNERVGWVERNIAKITSVAKEPLRDRWWTEADNPFLFLAACMELEAALAEGVGYISHLPVSFDGACNGLQHLCAMTGAPEGKLVNLEPGPEPQDVYQSVADLVKKRLNTDLKDPTKRALARMCLDYVWAPDAPGRPRKTVKPSVMTYFYSSTRFGMTEQLRDDTMRPLEMDVLRKKLKVHPFGQDKGHAASKYLVQHIRACIEDVVKRPARAMAFLQSLARALAFEDKPVRWTTPAGLPWINRYHKSLIKPVRLWLHEFGVNTVSLADGYEQKIDRNKAANGVAPNFVHALDAAHLMLTVNAAVAEGITSIATVHDSYSCLPSQAARFRKIIREEFVRMYEKHDVLDEVYEQACDDLGVERLPFGLPDRGPLDIKAVLDAEYAFA